MGIVAWTSLLLATSSPPPVAVPPVIPVVSQVWADEGGPIHAAVMLLLSPDNLGMAAPDTIDAVIHADGRDVPVVLRREGAPFRLGPGQWRQATYDMDRPAGVSGDVVLSLGGGHDGYRFALAQPGSPDAAPARLADASPSPAEGGGRTVSSALPVPPGGATPPPRTANGFLGNLSTYNPIYAVMGGGTDTNAKLEISFKYQLFGRKGDPDGSWLNGFYFAYTQRMFWDTAADSAPFRDVNYQPEFLYMYALPKNARGDQLSVRGGYLHESNGRDGSSSRTSNILYVQPQLDLPLGHWIVSVGPRVFTYILPKTDNPDIARYRGHQALAFSIGEQNGLKLSTWSRLNFGTGKGSVDADLSYPLTRFWHELPLYLIVQGFTGYGEDMLDYDRKQTRLRVGIGIVR
ncbi:phospholipase A [Sphingomonas abietis]|uniref:Phospholipase A1 n=1 Tax=Sphingomonas abietis TaxID=3012344 RepID=A0ABY7NQ58_9SPHN|nr:phospholipase A [Sphingomonas abietis]WBO23523.1 phospholipase A [Sphingomonas abietis]